MDMAVSLKGFLLEHNVLITMFISIVGLWLGYRIKINTDNNRDFDKTEGEGLAIINEIKEDLKEILKTPVNSSSNETLATCIRFSKHPSDPPDPQLIEQLLERTCQLSDRLRRHAETLNKRGKYCAQHSENLKMAWNILEFIECYPPKGMSVASIGTCRDNLEAAAI